MWMSVYSRVIGNNILRRLESRFHASKIKVGSSKMSSTNLAMRTIGKPNSKDFRVYLEKANGDLLSYFHDVPLFADKEKCILNAVIEIPRWTNGKLEISKDEPLNPIKQDVSKGKVRYISNVYPHKGYMWNYGALPQTWESPLSLDKYSNCFGDNDPLDIIEIGSALGKTGEIKQVKVLGALALIDGGEADWKIIVLDVNDPKASLVNNCDDVEKHYPGLIEDTKKWLRVYKIPEGKPLNELASNGYTFGKEVAFEIIKTCNDNWVDLITGKTPSSGEKHKIDVTNTTQIQSKTIVDQSSDVVKSIPKQNILTPDPIPSSVDNWYFVPSN